VHDVFTGGPIPEPALHVRMEPALVAADEMLPGTSIALPNLLHQKPIAVGRHTLSVTRHHQIARKSSLSGLPGRLPFSREPPASADLALAGGSRLNDLLFHLAASSLQ
jgi:hypothetical protein